MANRVKKCRLHPELEAQIAKYRRGVPMDYGFCPVCENRKTLDIIAEEAKRAGASRRF